MSKAKDLFPGVLFCLLIAVPAYFIGKAIPIAGGPVIAIIVGMLANQAITIPEKFRAGIRFCSKQILQAAVVFLGFGMDFAIVFRVGADSLPIIISTIATALIVAFILQKALKISRKSAVLIGVGSSICGGSAIAATAPVIGADDEEVCQAISVIFFFNVLAALLFPLLGRQLAFSTTDGIAFGTFAGTAINDTSSVTAAASVWDSMWGLGTQTLDYAVTVKLTRTLAIIPITLGLGRYQRKKTTTSVEEAEVKNSVLKLIPAFLVLFVLASLLTTILIPLGVPSAAFTPFKSVSKFLIILAMGAIGLNTDLIKLIKTGAKPILLGFICWVAIIMVCLTTMRVM